MNQITIKEDNFTGCVVEQLNRFQYVLSMLTMISKGLMAMQQFSQCKYGSVWLLSLWGKKTGNCTLQILKTFKLFYNIYLKQDT
jgi:hypothetical protein